MKVLCFGSLNYDYVYRVDHHVMPGETLSSTDMEIHIGGKGLNQAVAIAKTGVGLSLAGLIGEDGGPLLDVCAEYGIGTELLRKVHGKSGHAVIQVDASGQNCILLYGGSNRMITREYTDSVLNNFGEGDLIVLQNEINMPEYIIDRAYARGLKILLNPSPFNLAMEVCDLSKVSYFMVNEVEGGQLTGETGPEAIIRRMAELYPNAVSVLTLGADGALCFDGKSVIRQDAYKVKAVDTTAAGDAFTGYFVYGLTRGADMTKTLDLCAKAASITVMKKGAASSIPEICMIK